MKKKPVGHREKSESVYGNEGTPITVVQQVKHSKSCVIRDVIECDLASVTLFHAGFEETFEIIGPGGGENLVARNLFLFILLFDADIQIGFAE